jgi:acetyltransferase
MKLTSDLNVFLNPSSVAVIGASERPASWGSFIMEGLLSVKYSGKIFPVNPNAERVFGLRAYPDIRRIKDPVDLAVMAVPQKSAEDILAACAQKAVKGITAITAGFAETSDDGRQQQAKLANLARSAGLRLLGPNVSGTFNLHANFNASSIHEETILKTPIAAVCQGGYAFHDILTSAGHKNMGVGKFIHTGNEADLTITDFLEFFGQDPEIKAIVLYIEAIRDGQRFMEVANTVIQKKPIVVYKGGRTADSARAAQSHTAALSGEWPLYRGMFRQTGIVVAPAMELLLPIAHALIERPPLKGRRIGIITMGGSWGVALSDCLAESGLTVPEFGPGLQDRLRARGLPIRASSKNPLDFGASGKFIETDFLLSLGREILQSGEVDALVVHGIGRPGMHTPQTAPEMKLMLAFTKEQILGFVDFEKEFGLPVIIGNHHSPWESQTVSDLNKQGIRFYSRLHDIAWLLAAMQKP